MAVGKLPLYLKIFTTLLTKPEFKWGSWGIHGIDGSNFGHMMAVEWARWFTWTTCVSCIKLSILFAYRDLFRCITWFVRCVHAMMIFCVLCLIAFILVFCLRCKHFTSNFGGFDDYNCAIKIEETFYLIGGVSLFTDFVLLVMPLPVVWTLKISPLKKLGVSAMFGLGLLSDTLLLRLHTRRC
jgi:hypothetical protein